MLETPMQADLHGHIPRARVVIVRYARLVCDPQHPPQDTCTEWQHFEKLKTLPSHASHYINSCWICHRQSRQMLACLALLVATFAGSTTLLLSEVRNHG